MSIPGVFAPVEHGTQVFSDGAAVDNLPVDVARQMGADIVIAVYLDTGAFDRKSLSSLVGVAGRNVEIMISANELNSMKNANILLKADVSKFTSGDFEESAKIIPKGEEVAQEHAAELEKYAVSDAEWQAYLKQRNSRRRTKVPEPKFVDVYGIHGVQQAEVEEAFTKYVNQPVNTQSLENTITDLQGTGIYSSISYNLIERDGETGLLVRPRLKSYGPPFLNVGLTLSSNDSNDIELGLGGRATFFGMAGPGSELRVNASVGQFAGVNGELYKPLHVGSRYFVAPRAYYGHNVISDLGFRFNARTELRVGEDYQWYGESLRVGSPVEQVFHITPFISNVTLHYFGQDNVQVPTRGTEVQTRYAYSTQRPNSSEGYSQWNSSISHFIPVHKRGIIFGSGFGGTSFGVKDLGLAGFSLGGPLRLSAYHEGELLGSDYFLAQGGYLYRLTQINPVIGDSIYVAGFYEIGKVWNGNPGTPSLPNDISGAVILKTLIGPIYGGASIGDSDHRKWFFGLGRIF